MKTIKKYETCGTKHKDCKCCLEHTNIKYDLIPCKCLCNRNHQKKFNESLNRDWLMDYELSNHDINKFISLLRRGVYP